MDFKTVNHVFIMHFQLFQVNGANAHPLFNFLKEKLPYPDDNTQHLMTQNHLIIWNPVKRSDIAWNFEKFLIGADGNPIKRYSNKFVTKDLAADIEAALKK